MSARMLTTSTPTPGRRLRSAGPPSTVLSDTTHPKEPSSSARGTRKRTNITASPERAEEHCVPREQRTARSATRRTPYLQRPQRGVKHLAQDPNDARLLVGEGRILADISQIRPMLAREPTHCQQTRCTGPRYAPFERCISCSNPRSSSACRFRGIRLFAVRPESTTVANAQLKPIDLAYLPAFASAITETKPGHQAGRMEAVEPSAPNRYGQQALEPSVAEGADNFVLTAIAGTVSAMVARELAFSEAETAYRGACLNEQRLVCDTCLTNIFNGYWMCCVCGMEICVKCRDEWSASRSWQRIKRCTYWRAHLPQHMVRMCIRSTSELRWVQQTVSLWTIRLPAPSNDATHPYEDIGDILTAEERHSPRTFSVIPGDDKLLAFQQCWKRGRVCVVRGLQVHFDHTIWTPQWFIKHHGAEFTEMLDCTSGTAFDNLTVGVFFNGFHTVTERPFNVAGRRLVLKLKDWPSNDAFCNKFPQHYKEFMNALPFKPYTHPTGDLNLVTCLPLSVNPPDLGPKMYNAYGSKDGEDGRGTTNLHLDMADAVNVLVYASYAEFAAPSTANDTTINSAIAEEEQDAAHANGCTTAEDCTKKPDGVMAAAVWDIYHHEDLPMLRKFLHTVAKERGTKVDDPIHDQAFYLNATLRARLRNEYGVSSCRVWQNPGDAVFVPAGYAHQVCNYASCIKVAMDFVSPENIGRCSQLTDEFRQLSRRHQRKADILQLESIIYNAWIEHEARLTRRRMIFDGHRTADQHQSEQTMMPPHSSGRSAGARSRRKRVAGV